MSILPLLFIKTGKEILFYYLINVLVIFFFVLHLQSEFSLADAERNEFLVDSFIAFSFVAFFSYRFFRIYQKALEKAKEAEKAIQDQYRNLEASTEEMEVMNDELVSIHNEVLESSQRLAEEKERLAITLDSIDDGVITFDVRGMITSVNQAAEDILSMDKSRLESGNVAEVFRLKDAGNVEIQNDMKAGILERGENYEFKDDIVLATGDGVQKIISGKAVPLYDLNGKITGGVVAFRDITQQKRIQDESIKSSKIESLGVFAGGIAHDFNNLLTAILGCISIARLNLESDNHNVEFLVEAEKASLSAKGLTQQLLSFSKGGAPIKALSSLKGIIRETSGFVLRAGPGFSA
jgi:PAS domain S-box-containing protein